MNNTLNNNNANSNNLFHGIYLSNSRNNTLNNNNAFKNNYGIYLSNSWNNTMNGNYINSNYNHGIYLSSSLPSSNSNNIYNNYFNNTVNFGFTGSYTGINTWNITRTSYTNIIGGPYLGGNFWANPDGTGFSQTCADPDKDGICNSIYALASGNVDYLPLTIPAGYSYIYGTVLNNTTGIANALVVTNTSIKTNADASGKYSLLVLTGTYKLNGSREPRFYPNSSINVTVVAGTSMMKDIELLQKPTGNISGSVSIK